MVKGNKSPKIKLLVLDILKPHTPNIVEFSRVISETNGVLNAEVSVYAVDEKTESVKAVVEGRDLHFEKLKSAIEDFGASVHSVDRVVIGQSSEKLKLHEYELHHEHVL